MFYVDNDLALLHETGIYQTIGKVADTKAPLKDRAGRTMGPWNASTKRRKIARANVGGVSITHSIRRAADSWSVVEETVFESTDFRAEYGEVREWTDFDPTKPFPYTAYDDPESEGGSIWNEITGEHDYLRLDEGAGHFFNWIGLSRDEATPIIDQCEEDGSLDTHAATIARLVLA